MRSEPSQIMGPYSRIARSSGSRTLVLMSDNRPLQTNRSAADYHSLAAFINAIYCRRQGYDFLYFQPRLGFWHDLKRNAKEPRLLWRSARATIAKIKPLRLLWHSIKQKTWVPSVSNTKYWNQEACCYNYTLDQYRAASWGKLVSLKYALTLGYDYLVYIDSDCVFVDHSTSIENFIERTPVQVGNPFPKSCIGFLKNTPYEDDLPCAGFIVVKNCAASLSFLKEWWDFPNESKNFDHPYEQSSLHGLFRDNMEQLCVWDSIFFLEKEGQFLRHINIPELRQPYLTRVVDELQTSAKEYSFRVIMTELKAKKFIRLKTPSVAWS